MIAPELDFAKVTAPGAGRATVREVKVHLIDGTYELFRQHFGMAVRHGDSGPNAAALGVVNSTLQLVQKGATHVGVASDHVIESFRNDLYAGYKSSDGMDPVLLDQIPVMEKLLVAAGFITWDMVQWEADDALGAAAAVAEADPRVDQVLIVTPDKDLGQCVRGTRVVQYDRRKDEIVDEDAVIAKFGVPPSSIADYLALVGDSADGYPGLPGWGAKGAATVLARWGTIEAIPVSSRDWDLPGLRGAEKLATTLQHQLSDALLFKVIATVALDVPVGVVDDWRWTGPTPQFRAMAERMGAPQLAERAERLAKTVSPAG